MQRGQGGEAKSAGREALVMPYVCAVCSKLHVVVPGSESAGAPRCSCGGELAHAVLEPGVYELGSKKTKKRRKKAALTHAAPATPREADQGYNESHGYGPSHGGPTSPGDAPAAEALMEETPPKEEAPSPQQTQQTQQMQQMQKERDPDGPGSPA